MSRRNQNNNNSCNNYQYQYGHYPNMVWHAPHAAYQTEPYGVNNDYNYYTTGKFKRRFNNSNVSQNQNYGGHVSYDNMPNSNWRYRNSVSNTNQHKDRRKRGDPNHDNTSFMTNSYRNYNSNPNCSNDRQLFEGRFLNKSKQAKISKQETAHFDDSARNTISSGNAINVDEMERPSTRIISKKSLKENAHLSNKLVKQTVLVPLAPALHYTDYYWLKHRESGVDDDEEFIEPEDPCYVLETRKKKTTNDNENQNTNKAKNKKQRPEIKKTNEFEKKVIKMLTAPVEMSKGRSLLEKMGWKGGGLGKDGEGIVEPIAPTLYYVGTSMGLGQLTEEDEKPDFVDHVYLRTLKIILDFVKNDLEKELKFDPKLTPMERKRIHRTVQEMMDVEKFPEPYKSVIMDINHHNDYALHTESDGHRKTRHLTLYKEPHQHMYIVVPDDLSFEEGNVDCKVDSNKMKNIKENNVPESSQHSIEIKSEENKAMEDIICINESNNVVENVQIPQDKLMVMNEENITRLENEVMVRDSNLIEEISNVVDDVGITPSKSTLTKEDTMSQSENEVMENDNTFTEESSCILDDVVITQEESTFMEGKKISQLENKLNIDDNDDVNDRDGILNTIGDIENEELDKDNNIEKLSSQDKEHNQETTQDSKLIENDQENVQNIHENESNVNIGENNSIVKPGQKKLTKKQIRKLRAAEKIKANKMNNVTAKNVIHIKKKENNKKEVSEILDTIIKYFIEYTKDPLLTEFRFLGPFDYKERCAIKMFFEVCKGRHVIDKSKEVLELFDSDDFYQKLRQDNNGRDVIYKIRKDTYRLE